MNTTPSVTVTALLGATAGVCLTAGLTLTVTGLVGTNPATRMPRSSGWVWRLFSRRPEGDRATHADRRAGWAGTRTLRRVRWLVVPAVGLLVWLVSGWLVAGLIAAAVAAGAPALFGTGRRARLELQRLEALQAWTRRLTDLRTAGGGLEQTLAASLKTCPEPIRDDVSDLVARMRAGWRVGAALHAFADDLASPAGDLVVAVLVLDAERRGSGVASVLDDLADAVADEVTMRRKIEADRARPRTSARIVTAITLGAAVVGAFNTTYIQPYGTPLGQLVLAAIAAGTAGCLWWIRRVATGTPEPRVLHESDGFGITEGGVGANSGSGDW